MTTILRFQLGLAAVNLPRCCALRRADDVQILLPRALTQCRGAVIKRALVNMHCDCDRKALPGPTLYSRRHSPFWTVLPAIGGVAALLQAEMKMVLVRRFSLRP